MGNSQGFVCYQLGGKVIQFDRPVANLEPFRAAPKTPVSLSIESLNADKLPDKPDIQAEGWMVDRLAIVSLWEAEPGLFVDIPAAGRFLVATAGKAIYTISIAEDCGEQYLAEALLGPPLILALALQDSWCLHASAVTYNGKCVVFLGDSGAGKSTLAAYLSRHSEVHLAADDILPIAMAGSHLSAQPHFPQLKIPPGSQPGVLLPESLPLSAVCLLGQSEDVSIKLMNHKDAMLLLSANTVAARLFNKEMLTRHFDFCSQACKVVPVYRLDYPRIYEFLPQVWQTLKDQLDG